MMRQLLPCDPKIQQRNTIIKLCLKKQTKQKPVIVNKEHHAAAIVILFLETSIERHAEVIVRLAA